MITGPAIGEESEEVSTPAGWKVTESERLFIGNRSFTVQIHEEEFQEEVPKGQVPLWGRTVQEIRILDRAGSVHFAEAFHVPRFSTGFEYSFSVIPYLLVGETWRGILLVRDAIPSAPASGRSIRIFTRQGEKVRPFTQWLTVYGRINGISPSANGRIRLQDGRIPFTVWTGYFGVVVPLSVDLENARTRIPEGLRTFSVEDRMPEFFRDPDPVELYVQPLENSPTISVPVKRDSRIEYIEALTEASFVGEKTLELRVQKPWLHLRVNGQEGWVREEKDLIKVGLSPAG